MDLQLVISELNAELQSVNEVIAALEKLAEIRLRQVLPDKTVSAPEVAATAPKPLRHSRKPEAVKSGQAGA